MTRHYARMEPVCSSTSPRICTLRLDNAMHFMLVAIESEDAVNRKSSVTLDGMHHGHVCFHHSSNITVNPADSQDEENERHNGPHEEWSGHASSAIFPCSACPTRRSIAATVTQFNQRLKSTPVRQGERKPIAERTVHGRRLPFGEWGPAMNSEITFLESWVVSSAIYTYIT